MEIRILRPLQRIAVIAALLCLFSTAAFACPGGQEERCGPFGVCICLPVIGGIPPPPIPNPLPPPNPAECLSNPLDCIIKNNPAIMPIVERYVSDLRGQANGRWKSLPQEFISEFGPRFPQIDLRRVRYAEGINTRHGQHITLCDEVFLTGNWDDADRDDLALMLHELYHTVQCHNRGGLTPFVNEYVAHAAGTIVQSGSFNIHDDIDMERDAESLSSNAINAFGWPFVIDNGCRQAVRILVRFQDTNGAWVNKGWYTFDQGEASQLVSQGRYLHSTNGYWYWHAETLDGNLEWSGKAEIPFGQDRYGAIEVLDRQPRGAFTAYIGCDR